MLKKSIPGIFHSLLRSLFYNRTVENIFYPSGSSQKINGETIKIPFRFRHFYPSVYEIEKIDFIKQHCRPGSTAIDIGAHIGIFSFFLANQVGKEGKVYSFEPTPFTFSILKKTIRLNKLEDIITVRQQAVSNTHNDVAFYIYKGSNISNANSVFIQNITRGNAKRIKVAAMLLDDLMTDVNFKDLSFIKIDAEGAELEILKGGTRLIGKYRPFMTLEIHPKSFEDPAKTQEEIFGLLKSLKYDIYKADRNLDMKEFCSATEVFEVLLIPSKMERP